MAGQPKTAFYVAVFLVVAALVGFAIWRADIFAPEGEQRQGADVDPQEFGKLAGGQQPGHGSGEPAAEAPDQARPTTFEKYTFVARETIPQITEASDYVSLDETDNTVKFSLNVWAGWAPIILANEGFQARKVWKTADGQEFKVELVLIDDPSQMRTLYAQGQVHIGWATVDMLPLVLQALVSRDGTPRDPRTMPRVYQQIDWSSGGDGIVVREAIRTMGDLKGKKVALAQNSPSHYFLLYMMSAARLQPSDIEMVFTPTAFDAAAAFNGDPSIAGAVSWAPDIYNLSEVAGNRLLVSTATANKLIADVWFARADFARDHQGKLEALVRGIFDAMEALKTDEAKQRCARLMAAGYDIPVEEVQGMFADAHSTNWAENRQFFLNRNNPTNFETVYNNAYRAYRLIGTVNHEPVPFEQIMDPSILEKLGQDDKYASQQDESRVVLQPKPLTEIRGAEADPGIVVSTFTVHFYPNSADLYKKVIREKDGQQVEELYEPEVDEVLDEIARLAGSFGIAYINISGHTDASMKGKIPETLVEELSRARAEAVRDALLNRYRDLGPERFTVEGVGWGRPADPEHPNDHARNRRVEVQVYPAEVE